MKKFLLLITVILFSKAVFSQTEISRDDHGNKILKGFVTREELATDTAFAWYAQNQQGYIPNQTALQAFKANKDLIYILVFGGTWCDDTHYILPKFFMLADAAGIAPDRITLMGVDRNKKTIKHLSEIFNITNVPTIIIFKNGKELGRVVEYGHSGLFDKDLGEILTKK